MTAAFGSAQVADAIVALGRPVIVAPALRPLFPCPPVSGPVRAVSHVGSIDVFLEAIADAAAGDILLVANEGRLDEGCLGDLVVLEARNAGLAAVIVDGAHRDSADLVEIGLSIWSRGACPFGPRGVRVSKPPLVIFGEQAVETGDWAVADADGVVIIPRADVEAVLERATLVSAIEEAQRKRMREGSRLRDLLEFTAYQERQAADPAYSFRMHLSAIGGAGET